MQTPKSYLSSAFLISLTFLLLACSPNQGSTSPTSLPPLRLEVVAADVELVVALDISPDGRLFYATQSGGVFTKQLQPNADGQFPPAVPLIDSLDVARGSESGLLGLALAPNFSDTHHFFLYYTVPDSAGEPLMGRIVRYTEADGQATDETVIVDNLPTHPQPQFHFGGALTIGPDDKIYLIFGDANMPALATDPDFLEGSILRYDLDGGIPADNPFPGSPVYAYGIRNGFGLAFHPETGLLYESENGESCDDELNLIEPGVDYGWGVYAYDQCPYPDDHATPPLYQWTPPIAPAGMIFYTGGLIPELNGDLLLCGFNSAHMYQLTLSVDGRQVDNVAVVQVADRDDFCRIAILQGPDGWIYTSTHNTIYRIGR